MRLLRTDIPVAEVCFSIGFESLSSFSGLFKRSVGLTASAYMAQHHRIKTQILKTPLKFVPGCFADKNDWTKKSTIEEHEK